MRIGIIVAAIVLLTSAVASAQVSTPSNVVAKPVGAGVVFTNRSGMALYTYGRDMPGTSTCVQTCATDWPPLGAADEIGLAREWSVVVRPDGGKQWAYKGEPLYTYAKDAGPGTSFGDNVGNVWRVAAQDMWTPAEVAIGPSLIGRVLVDTRAMTLYTNDGDKVPEADDVDFSDKPGAIPPLKSACTKRCLDLWHPVLAPAVGREKGDWSVVRREDGSLQWAFKGKPLYTYANDLVPTDVMGNGSDRAWQAAVVEPPPPQPKWITFQASDAGELLANATGQTIYTFNAALNQARRSNLSAPATCDAECVRTWWTPVAAEVSAQDVGNWSILKNEDGARQWAYKGEPLYTHVRDKKPGDVIGTRFTGSRAWRPIMRNGAQMQGQGGN